MGFTHRAIEHYGVLAHCSETRAKFGAHCSVSYANIVIGALSVLMGNTSDSDFPCKFKVLEENPNELLRL